MRTLIVGLAVAVTLAGAGEARAQDTRAAARDVVTKWQAAIVNVRVVLKTRMSMGGREMQSNDDSVDAVGTVIDPSGLTVMSLGSLNPGAMMSKIVGASTGGGGAESRVDISSEPTELKIRLSDGRELPAKIVLRDEDLDLAFIRPTTKPATPLTAISLADSAKPVLLEQVVVLSRLGRVGGWAASAALVRHRRGDRAPADLLRAWRRGSQHGDAGVQRIRPAHRPADAAAGRSRAVRACSR